MIVLWIIRGYCVEFSYGSPSLGHPYGFLLSFPAWRNL